ncbi:hypothetical protein GCM10010123_32510 [Pilimelia anulata]|uniref:YCII-related domain-containing protein n=1 Tax=Pilimelia anulata TaxID=53371 RepID=A0A8J3FB29_9ACTN|nr:YciI family protein [Pilimelia anulata]GGK00125.1 hypothetical protein GCM10010123_32510 [Pilimelia anulata]
MALPGSPVLADTRGHRPVSPPENRRREFFCYHRDRRDSPALRAALLEQHGSYMDAFAMVARGPTLAADGVTPTGSVHIVDVPDVAAARAFALDGPDYRAGVYRDVLLRRRRNLLGRTMWEFPGDPDGDRYLVLGRAAARDGRDRPGPGRPDRVRAAALRRRRHPPGHGGAAAGAGPRPRPAHPGPVRGDRGAPVDVRRPASPRYQPGGRPAAR